VGAEGLALLLVASCVFGAEQRTDSVEQATDAFKAPNVDWEALLQTGGGEKLSVSGNAAVATDLTVGGEGTVKGKFTAHDDVEIHKGLTVRGATLSHGGAKIALGMLDGLKQGNKPENRALVHSATPVDSLHINFDGDFEGGVVVGGPHTMVQGKLSSKDELSTEKNMVVKGEQLVLGQGDGKKQGAKTANRAMQHGSDPEDSLLFNVDGDFEGGVFVQGKGLNAEKIGIGAGARDLAQADLHIVANSDAVILMGNAQKSKNAVFIKAVGGTGAGVDMALGSTTSDSAYGRLTMDFPSKISMLGAGGTHFDRGNTVFASGRVGVGAKASNPSHGFVVESEQKAGHPDNDVAVKQGSVRFHGGLYDTSSKGEFFLDLDVGGNLKNLNVVEKLGVGTTQPTSPFGDNVAGLLHVADAGHPVVTLENTKGTVASIVYKTPGHQFNLQLDGDVFKIASEKSNANVGSGSEKNSLMTLDKSGKIGIGKKNDGKYGVSLEINEADDHPFNDLALPKGNLRMKGKIYDTFDGGDKFYLDPSHDSNVQNLNIAGKFTFGPVPVKDPQFEIELPAGATHITLGRTLFLNGFGGDSARVTNNAYISPGGKWALYDKTKMASAMEMKNNGKIEMLATKEAGKLDWQLLFGMDAPTNSVFSMGNFGVGTQTPKHALEMKGGDATFSLGDNMFLNGGGSTNMVAANAYLQKGTWVIQKKDRFASSIQLKDSGKIEMYGTVGQGSAEWKKMLGFDAPKGTSYAFGKFGINTESPEHTLSIPSGDHHISLGNNLFLNGAGKITRVMGNAFMKLGKYAISESSGHGMSVEMDSGKAQMNFGGGQAVGSPNFLNMMTINFAQKTVAIPSGRLGVKTVTPKVSLDVRGNVNLQDKSNAAVIYSPASGPGLFIRVSDTPGTYAESSERYFFGSNSRVGFGTTAPEGKLHISSKKGDTAVPLLVAETSGGSKFKLQGTEAGFKFVGPERKWLSFAGGNVDAVAVKADAAEESQNGAKYSKTAVLLAPSGGRVGIGGTPQSHHNLEITGNGALLSGGSAANRGVLAFANDGGGAGFQLDYFKGKMMLGSLPPTHHLKKTSAATTHMTFTDAGHVGIGTDTPTVALNVKSSTGVKIEHPGGASWTYNVAADGALEFSSSKGGFFSFDGVGGLHLNKVKKEQYKFEVSGKGLRLQGDRSGAAPLLFAPDVSGKGFRMDYQKDKMYFGHESGEKWHMVMADTGMVGVGTVNPAAGMHVKHDKGIAIEHNGKTVQRWHVATQPTAELAFSYMGDTQVSFSKEGNVGIGTQKPTKKLHVEGDAFISGKLHVDNNYAKKLAAKNAKPKEFELSETEALIQLDEHVAGRVDEDNYGVVDSEGKPSDMAKMMSVMHKVLQSHQEEIRMLKDRLQKLEAAR